METMPRDVIRQRAEESEERAKKEKIESRARQDAARARSEQELYNYSISHPVEYGVSALRKEVNEVRNQIRFVKVLLFVALAILVFMLAS